MQCRLARCVRLSLNPDIMLPLPLPYLVSYLMTFTLTFSSSIKLQNKQGSDDTIITLIHNFIMPINTIACMFLILSLMSKASSSIAKPTVEERYKNWLVRYGGRSHNTSLEMENQFAIYKSNVDLIDVFNSQNHSFSLTDNKFADMTNEEFKAMNIGKLMQEEIKEYEDFINDSHVPPCNLDWRKKGAVVDVKDQGSCGSCWAFSTVGAVESLTKIKTGKLISLSEQELLDCDVNSNNNGCFGGFLSNAYDFIVNHGSLTTSDIYPYTGKPGTCIIKRVAEKAANISGYKRVIPCNENLLLRAVAKQPVSVAIAASSGTFQFYSEGIYNDVECSYDKIGHAVVIVGYGNSGGHDYWIVKNSWGKDWGDAGYIKMARNVPNVECGICGIATQAYYPY